VGFPEGIHRENLPEGTLLVHFFDCCFVPSINYEIIQSFVGSYPWSSQEEDIFLLGSFFDTIFFGRRNFLAGNL